MNGPADPGFPQFGFATPAGDPVVVVERHDVFWNVSPQNLLLDRNTCPPRNWNAADQQQRWMIMFVKRHGVPQLLARRPASEAHRVALISSISP